jgi:dTDP-4-dehydrorhamnose 3,5-epimerase
MEEDSAARGAAPWDAAPAFRATAIEGGFVLEEHRREDVRGHLAQLFGAAEFARQGLRFEEAEAVLSLDSRRFTLRGLHYRLGEAAEPRLLRCLRGALHAVMVDLRPDSPSFGRWCGARLDDEDRLAMLAPRGAALGCLTLEPATEALWLHGGTPAPEEERGLRWNDPLVGIDWPERPAEMSEKDRTWPDFDPAFHGIERLRGLR